jgi:hypothetical protein
MSRRVTDLLRSFLALGNAGALANAKAPLVEAARQRAAVDALAARMVTPEVVPAAA